MSRPIAAFDFDGTLLDGDCLLILHSLVRSPLGRAIDGLRLLPALLQWKCGLHSTAWFKQAFLQRLLTPAMHGRTIPRRLELLNTQLANALWQRLRPEALARLEWHRQQGHRVVIVSASPRCLLQPVAKQLGVELIATETTNPCDGPPIQFSSPNCKGHEKLRRLQTWLQEPLERADLHAYGDSLGDRELLMSSTHPHWRSFTAATHPYPEEAPQNSWITVLVVMLLASALAGVIFLEPSTQTGLISSLTRLPRWMPSIVAILAMSYAGRYWRFRLLLSAETIGRSSCREALVWFQGFALTATPGKIGELSRVQLMHRQLGYPRAPLVHIFLAERLCDVAAVLIWLGLLLPGQLKQRFSTWGPPSMLFAGITGLLIMGLGAWGWQQRHRWQHHLPSGQLAHACLPASGLSLAIWGIEAMILWLLVQAISPSQTLSAGQAISIYLLSGSAGMVSLIPGGLGANETASTLLLHQAGIPTSLALSIAILRRLCSLWLITGLANILRLLPTKRKTAQTTR